MLPDSNQKQVDCLQSLHTTVLLSGGIDSAALLHFLIARPYSAVDALFVNYGQEARAFEQASAERLADHYGLNLDVVSISGLPNSGPGFIFGRNALLVLLAASRLSQDMGVIALGIHSGTEFVDCKRSFVVQLQGVLDLYSEGRMRILAPFLTWTKLQVYNYSESVNIPLSITRSCEAGTEQPCGVCLSCRDLEAIHARKGTPVDISR